MGIRRIHEQDGHNVPTVTVEEIYIMPKVERVKERRRRGIKVNGRDITRLSELIDSNSTIGGSALLNAAPNLLRVKNETFGRVDVPGGFDVTKGVFNLTVREASANVIKTIYVIGYTDSYDVSFSGRFDDQAEFHINKMYVVSQTKTRGGLSKPRLVDVFSVTDNSFSQEKEELHLLRTEDVILSLVSDVIYDDVSAKNNTTNNTSAKPVSRSVAEGIGNRSVRSMMDSIVRSSNSYGMQNNSAVDTLTNAYNMTTASSLHTLEFIGILSDRSNYTVVTSFNLQELDAEFGNFEVYTEKNVQRAISSDYTKDFNDLNSNNNIATVANEILFNIASIAAENALINISFTANNVNGSVSGQVLDADTIIKGIDAIGLAEIALRTFLVEIWPTISEHNSRTLEIVLGYTSGHRGAKLEIAFDGDAFESYYMASYMDALLSPDIHTDESYNTEMRSYGTLKKLLI